MKKLILIFFLFSSLFVQAQTNGDEVGEEDTILLPPIPVEHCFPPSVQRQCIVRYASSATAHFNLENATENTISYNIVGEGNRRTVQNEHGFLLAGLALDRQYEVRTLNTCGEEVIIAAFSTSRNDYPTLSVSQEVFNETGRFANTPEVTIYDFITTNENLDYYEKLSFLQDYYFEGREIPDDIRNDEYPPNTFRGDGPSGGADADCNCKMYIVHRPLQGVKNPDGSITPSSDPSFAGSWGNGSNWATIYQLKGAAKYQEMTTRGMHITGREKTFAKTGTGSSTMFSELAYHWLCTNKSGAKSDKCVCEKEVELTSRYDSRLVVTAKKLTPCFLCGARGSSVKVEDHAVLTVGSSSGAVSVIAAGGATASSSCNRNTNTQFFIDLVGIAGNLGKAYVQLKYGAKDSTAVRDTSALLISTINDLVKDLKDIIKQPIIISTPCEAKDSTVTFVHTQYKVPLKANNPVWIRMTSFSAIVGGGYTAWINTGRILSDVHMGGVIYGGFKDDQEKYCCSDKIANWVMGSFPVAPLEYPALKGDLAAFFALHPVIYDGTEVGKDRQNNCTDGGGGGGGKIALLPIPSPINYFEAIVPNTLSDELECSIFDTSGRLVLTDKCDSSSISQTTFVNKLKNTLGAGLYLARLKSNNEYKTIKFVITN